MAESRQQIGCSLAGTIALEQRTLFREHREKPIFRQRSAFLRCYLSNVNQTGQRSGDASNATMQAVRKPVLFIASTLELLAGSGQIPCWREDKQGLAGFPSFSPLVVGRREGFA